MNKLLKIASLLLALFLAGSASAQQEIDLAGTWGFETDVMDFRRASVEIRGDGELHQTIVLPGITDDYSIGYASSYSYCDRLTRRYEYMAPAWYRKRIEIPHSWSGKRIHLYLERTHWLSAIYRGRNEVSRCDFISVPHVHDLTGSIEAGRENVIDLMIDNRYQYDTHKWNHSHTEFTQINWNGVIGELKLVALDPIYIDDMQIFPDTERRQVRTRVRILNTTGQPFEGALAFEVSGQGPAITRNMEIKSNDSISEFEATIPLGDGMKLWDEFSPALYTMECTLTAGDCRHRSSSTFGMREVRASGDDILLNGHRIHLRGTVNNAEFPLSGHVPMDDASWERIFTTLKSYGMNHIRFHSWCPPAACFRAADRMGVYLEVEMPMWGRDAKPGDEARNNFFRRELKAILREYGNHPSFLLYCNGNELEGDFDFLNELTDSGRRCDDRRLYSGATARRHVESEQFYISHRSAKGSVTVYEGRPGTDWDINAGHGTGQPIISHETGQRCMYPNFDEIPRYTGPVEARNLVLYRDSLEAHGMLGLARDFFLASGQQTRIEYKDVIEAQLRSSLSSGFQMLGLTDFPGQGYAPVGLLDVFWESKGMIEPEKFREFCAPTVVLLRMPKRSYFTDEVFRAKAEIYNYSPERLRNPRVRWTIAGPDGKVLRSGSLRCPAISTYGVFPLGEFTFPLDRIAAQGRLTVRLTVNDRITNSWDIWLFPREEVKEILRSDEEVLFTTAYTPQARRHLQAGKKVVLLPKPDAVKGRKSVFHNHFWNPIMFKWAPLTLGCLIHSEQGMFADFPTERHLDWQWWDIITNAKVIEMDSAPNGLLPFIQPIDSYQHNRKLGIGFEANLLGGKLLVLAIDTEKNIVERPATIRLLRSIRNYVHSNGFAPATEIDEEFIHSFLGSGPADTGDNYEQDSFLNSFRNK